uniref:Ras-related protein Rab-18A n=1 Tax=Schistocephalus solidus TaxID=70667 RepID=A0A0X3P4V7_SCHSO
MMAKNLSQLVFCSSYSLHFLITGVDFHSKSVKLSDSSVIRASFWDTAGQERFRTLTPSFYRGAHGAIIIFDLGNRESFESLEKWFQEIQTYTNRPDLVRLLIGNKLDLEARQVTRDEALRFARLHKLLYAEVSAKTNEGVNHSFYELFEKIYSNPNVWINDGLTEAGAVRLNSRGSEPRKPACSCG